MEGVFFIDNFPYAEIESITKVLLINELCKMWTLFYDEWKKMKFSDAAIMTYWSPLLVKILR
jgi:hypothetical protein